MGRLLPLRVGLFALIWGLGACSAPAETTEDAEQAEAELTSGSDLVASKWMKLWSNLPKDRDSSAHYKCCQGQPFKFALSFRNMGSAIWRDVPGRGAKPGSDVHLETSNGKKSKLTGKVRYSLRWNANDWVRGDRKANECTTKPGCRRTRAVHDGISAKAPKEPGIYKSRWRLRDHSEVWGKDPVGFGPIAEMRLRVLDCPDYNECKCRVTCEDGSITTLYLLGGTEPQCEQNAELHCFPQAMKSFTFVPCTDPPDGGSGGSGGVYNPNPGDVNAEEPPDLPGYWITDSETAGGAGGSGGGSGGTSGSAGNTWWGGSDEDTGIGVGQVPEDPDYEPDDFDGVAEDVQPGTVALEDGCSISAERERSAALGLAFLVAAGALFRRRAQNRS